MGGGDHVDISAETPIIRPSTAIHFHQQYNKLVWSSGMTFASHFRTSSLSWQGSIGGTRQVPGSIPGMSIFLLLLPTFSGKGWMWMMRCPLLFYSGWLVRCRWTLGGLGRAAVTRADSSSLRRKGAVIVTEGGEREMPKKGKDRS